MTTPAYRLYGYPGDAVHLPAVRNVEQTLFSYVIPGGTLGADGAFLEFMADGNCLDGTDARYVKVKVAGDVVNQIKLRDNVTNWRLQCEIIRMSASAFKCAKFGGSEHGGNPGYNEHIYVSQGYVEDDLTGFDWSNDVTLEIVALNATSAIADYITGNDFVLKVWP